MFVAAGASTCVFNAAPRRTFLNRAVGVVGAVMRCLQKASNVYYRQSFKAPSTVGLNTAAMHTFLITYVGAVCAAMGACGELPSFYSRHLQCTFFGTHMLELFAAMGACGELPNSYSRHNFNAHVPSGSSQTVVLDATSRHRFLNMSAVTGMWSASSLIFWSQRSCKAHFSEHICWCPLGSHGCLRRAPKHLFTTQLQWADVWAYLLGQRCF